MRSFIIIAGLSTKCSCLCKKKKSLGVRHGYLSRILYCKSIRKSIFDKCKKRFETSQFDFFFNKCKDGFDTIKISFVALFGC